MITNATPLYTIYENMGAVLSDEPLVRNLTYLAWKNEMRKLYFESIGQEYDPYIDLNFNFDFLHFVVKKISDKK